MWTKTYKVIGFLEPGVVKFGDKNLMIYISKEAIERFAYRIKGKPVTIGHIEGITEDNAQQYSVGDVAMTLEPGSCVVTVNKEEGAQRIEAGERFSCCWVPVKWGPAGTWHNIPYDRELVEMDFTHLAIVPDPRYENVEVYMNSKSKEYNNATFRPRNDDGGPGFSRASADSQTKVARAAQKTVFNPTTFSEQPRQHKSIGDRKVVRVSNFENSLSDGQYKFLKKYIKNCKGYNNNNDDNSVERMDRINNYLLKRESRRLDKQFNKYEAPKQYADKASGHFSGYKNSRKGLFRYKDGKEFNNNVFRDALKRWDGNGRGESRINNTRSLLTDQTGKMPKISRGPKGASGRVSEAQAKKMAEDL